MPFIKTLPIGRRLAIGFATVIALLIAVVTKLNEERRSSPACRN
jgi:hypothetical protein